jgi:hypothetical protein
LFFLSCHGAARELKDLKICLKLGKTAREAFEMHKFVYGNYTLSPTRVFEWFKRFRDDDPRSGQPSAVQTSGTAAEV